MPTGTQYSRSNEQQQMDAVVGVGVLVAASGWLAAAPGALEHPWPLLLCSGRGQVSVGGIGPHQGSADLRGVHAG
jgi:hypothetical protein